MRNGEVIGTIEPGSGQRVIARAVAMQPGETYAQAVARQDARSARISVAVATIRAEGERRVYSDLSANNWVHFGQGLMSQSYFAEQQAARAY